MMVIQVSDSIPLVLLFVLILKTSLAWNFQYQNYVICKENSFYFYLAFTFKYIEYT